MNTNKFDFKNWYLIPPLLITLSACSDSSNYDFDASIAATEAQTSASNPPEALFNPNPADSRLPFPNSLFFSGTTDGLLNIPIAPDDDQTLANPLVALNQLDGFSTVSPIVTPVSEALNAETLVIGDTVRVFEVSTEAGIRVTSIDVESEIRDPAQMLVAEVNGQLTLIPTVPLKPATSYLVALTSGIRDLDDMPLEPSFVYNLLKGEEELTNTSLEALRSATGTHLEELEGAGIDSEDVALTWVFKTQNIGASIQAVKDISNTPSTLSLSNTNLNTASEEVGIPGLGGLADIWEGALDIPYYQSAPLEDGDAETVLNSFWKNADGNPTGALGPDGMPDYLPVKSGDEKIPVLLSVPNANAGPAGLEMPDQGWPVTVYLHGITRTRTDMLLVADAMAQAGRAVIAIDIPLHGVDESSEFHASNNPFGPRERTFELDVTINAAPDNESDEAVATVQGQDGIADPSGEHFDNLANLANARDNFRQAIVDLFVLKITIGSESAEEGLMLDASNVSFVGQSFGAIIGTSALSFDDTYTVATLGMPGGGIAQLLAASEQFGPQIEAALAAANIEVGSADYNQFLIAAQTMIDSSDPINYAAKLAQSNSTPLHMIEVIGDTVVPNNVLPTAPLSGTDPLARLLNLNQVNMNSVTGGLVKFTEGSHGSLINPESSLAATQEMQSQMVGFADSGDGNLTINNPEIIQSPP